MTRVPLIFRGIRNYVQGPGVLRSVGGHLARLGGVRHACVLIDQALIPLAPRVRESLDAAGIGSFVLEFGGDNGLENVRAMTEKLLAGRRPDVVLGIGGGKTIDVAKILASRLEARCAVCATTSSMDAAPSHAAVLSEAGGRIHVETLENNPDLVVIDSEVIAAAPARLFAAGIGDAVSKKYEMETAIRLGEPNAFGGAPVFFVHAMAETLQDCLLLDGEEAMARVRRGELNEAVERVITACVLLSTLVWENGGLAGAHSTANVLTNAGYAKRNLHGELVAFSLLLSLSLEGRHEERKALDVFFGKIGLPRRIGDLGIRLEDRETVDGFCRGVYERYKKHGLSYPAEDVRRALERLEAGTG
jgi:glycerol dehydrogenase